MDTTGFNLTNISSTHDYTNSVMKYNQPSYTPDSPPVYSAASPYGLTEAADTSLPLLSPPMGVHVATEPQLLVHGAVWLAATHGGELMMNFLFATRFVSIGWSNYIVALGFIVAARFVDIIAENKQINEPLLATVTSTILSSLAYALVPWMAPWRVGWAVTGLAAAGGLLWHEYSQWFRFLFYKIPKPAVIASLVLFGATFGIFAVAWLHWPLKMLPVAFVLTLCGPGISYLRFSAALRIKVDRFSIARLMALPGAVVVQPLKRRRSRRQNNKINLD